MLSSISSLLNIIIVFCAIFFFMSTVASHIAEVIAGYFNSRGRSLRRQLGAALTKAVANEILKDPIIRSFGKASRGKDLSNRNSPTKLPSYITPTAFSRAIVNRYNSAGSATSGSDVVAELWSDAQRRSVPFETTIEEWFQQFGDRITGTYTRYATVKLFLIGIAMAIVLDVDVVSLGSTMWADPQDTAKTVQAISDAMKQSDAAATAGQTPAADQQAPATGQQAPAAGGGDQAGDAQSPLVAAGKQALEDLKAKTVSDAVGSYGWQKSWPEPLWSLNWCRFFLYKLVGWFLAAAATALGAQFWFQLLTSGLKLRMVGKAPDASDDDDQAGDDSDAAAKADAAAKGDAPSGDQQAALSGNAAPAANLILASFAVKPAPILGELSSKYEVGNRGPGTVSSGVGDPGGISYGSYQLSTTAGTAKQFVDQAPDWIKNVLTDPPGSPNFSVAWKQLAQSRSADFFQAQHNFILATHYQPVCASVPAFDVPSRTFAMQNVVWSTAVQHGPKSQIVKLVVGKFNTATYSGSDFDLDGEIIRGIYAERGRRNADGRLVYFKNSPPKTQASVAQRFVDEAKDALAMLAAEENASEEPGTPRDESYSV